MMDPLFWVLTLYVVGVSVKAVVSCIFF